MKIILAPAKQMKADTDSLAPLTFCERSGDKLVTKGTYAKMAKYVFLIAIISMLLVSCGTTENNTVDIKEQEQSTSEVVEEDSKVDNSYETITAEQAKEIMDSETGYVILDVREADEYAEGHIDGAVQLSYTEIDAKAEDVLPDKDQLILVYCRSGRRSAIAAASLANLGYTNVKDFGGIIDWPYEVVK